MDPTWERECDCTTGCTCSWFRKVFGGQGHPDWLVVFRLNYLLPPNSTARIPSQLPSLAHLDTYCSLDMVDAEIQYPLTCARIPSLSPNSPGTVSRCSTEVHQSCARILSMLMNSFWHELLQHNWHLPICARNSQHVAKQSRHA